MKLKRVVITGLGALTPIGNTIQTYWQNLLAGKSGAAPITHFDATNFKTQFACEVKGFDAAEHLGRKEARRSDRFTQFALTATAEAIKDSALDLDAVDRDRMGVIWASAIGGFATIEEQVSKYALGNGVPRFSPLYIPKLLADSSSGMISMRYGLRGINYNTVSACASSNAAFIDAFNAIRLGKAQVMIAGGSEAGITPSMIGGFNALTALSTRNDTPKTASRPFDRSRDGFVMGEGAAALIFEEYEHAARRGATIYAEFIGGGASADAYHATAAHPDGDGAFLSMRSALEEAQINAGEIDYINPHATSTPVGDLSEVRAIQRLLGAHINNVVLGATKSMTGHLLGAAGAIEATACVLAIHNDKIPPTINTTELDPELPSDLNIALDGPIDRRVNVAMSNSFGFGGHNSTIILRKAS